MTKPSRDVAGHLIGRFLLPATMALVLMAGSARAGEVVHIVGAGTQTCAWWLEARRMPDHAPFLLATSWVLGFLSGFAWGGSAGEDPLNGINQYVINAWLDAYCLANPHQIVYAAAEVFAKAHPR